MLAVPSAGADPTEWRSSPSIVEEARKKKRKKKSRFWLGWCCF